MLSPVVSNTVIIIIRVPYNSPLAVEGVAVGDGTVPDVA